MFEPLRYSALIAQTLEKSLALEQPVLTFMVYTIMLVFRGNFSYGTLSEVITDMAIDLSVGDILLTRLEFQNPVSGVGYNLLHWRCAAITDTATGLPAAVTIPFASVAAEIAEEIYDLGATTWANAASNLALFTGVTIQDLAPTPKSFAYTYQHPTPTAGAIVSDMLPAQDTVSIKKITALAGRPFLGRMFFYGLPESMCSQGQINDDLLALIRQFGGSYDNPVIFTAGAWNIELRPVLYHGADSSGVPLYTNIVGFDLTDKTIKSQKRRRPGKGI